MHGGGGSSSFSNVWPSVEHFGPMRIPYARSGTGPVPASCYNGIKSLNLTAQTMPDRQAACKCLKSVSRSIFGLNYGVIAGLRGKCGVSILFKISPNTNCDSALWLLAFPARESARGPCRRLAATESDHSNRRPRPCRTVKPLASAWKWLPTASPAFITESSPGARWGQHCVRHQPRHSL
ncbi:hypothetical protein NL676_018803 [Syzygium grande]|nr:hypothetical protein NL676_018803 [Syzygium grande]